MDSKWWITMGQFFISITFTAAKGDTGSGNGDAPCPLSHSHSQSQKYLYVICCEINCWKKLLVFYCNLLRLLFFLFCESSTLFILNSNYTWNKRQQLQGICNWVTGLPSSRKNNAERNKEPTGIFRSAILSASSFLLSSVSDVQSGKFEKKNIFL